MAATVATMATPPSPLTPTSPGSSKRRPSNLSIDLSDLPPLSSPAEPSNTLIITNLQAPEIFTAANLENITQAINQHATIHSFSPLKSFRRIIVSFLTIDDAISIRKVLDGESVLGYRIRVYFGKETKINIGDQHLQAPKSDKLFFISPPPSPPMGWEMRNEEPPNKEVHAEDLAAALAQLHARPGADDALKEDVQPKNDLKLQTDFAAKTISRTRSGSTTIVYDPQDHGHSPLLPAIAVEDTTESPDEVDSRDTSPMEGVEKKFVHTSRPPVELME